VFDPEEAADPFFDDRPWSVFGEGKVACPTCSAYIPVPVLARMNGEAEQRLELQPDMSEVWSHAFTHEDVPPEGGNR